MSTNWTDFAKSAWVRFFASIILLLCVLIIGIGLFTNKPIKIGFIEFNRKDTVYKYIPTSDTNGPKNNFHIGTNRDIIVK